VKKILIALAVVLVVCVTGLLVTAVDQLVGLASRFHPLAGQVTFWILVSAIAGGSDTNTSAGHTQPVGLCFAAKPAGLGH
jgi:hypothetical protein